MQYPIFLIPFCIFIVTNTTYAMKSTKASSHKMRSKKSSTLPVITPASSVKLEEFFLYKASIDGNFEEAELLLSEKVNVNLRNDLYDDTPLHMAAYAGHIDIATLLLKNGANVNLKNLNGDTPLHMAAYAGHVEIVQLLLAHNAQETLNSNKKSPTDVAKKSWFSTSDSMKKDRYKAVATILVNNWINSCYTF